MVVMAEGKKMMSVKKFMEAIDSVYFSNHPSPFLRKPKLPQVRLERLPRCMIEKYTKRRQKSKSSKSSLKTSSQKDHKNTESPVLALTYPKVSPSLPLTENQNTRLNIRIGCAVGAEHPRIIPRSDAEGVRTESAKRLDADRAEEGVQEVTSSKRSNVCDSPSSDSDLPDLMNPKKTEEKKKKASPKKKKSKAEKKREDPKLMKKSKKLFKHHQKQFRSVSKDVASKTDKIKKPKGLAESGVTNAGDSSEVNSMDMESGIVIVSCHSLAESNPDHTVQSPPSEHMPSLTTSLSPPVPASEPPPSKSSTLSKATLTTSVMPPTSPDEEEILKKIKANMAKSLIKCNLKTMVRATDIPVQTANATSDSPQSGIQQQGETPSESNLQDMPSVTEIPEQATQVGNNCPQPGIHQQEKLPNISRLQNIVTASEIPVESANVSGDSPEPGTHQQEKTANVDMEPIHLCDESEDENEDLHLAYDSDGNESVDSDKTVLFESRSADDDLDVETGRKKKNGHGSDMPPAEEINTNVIQAKATEKTSQEQLTEHDELSQNRGNSKRKPEDLLEDLPVKRIKKEIISSPEERQPMVMIPLLPNTSASPPSDALSCTSSVINSGGIITISIAPNTTESPLLTAAPSLPNNTNRDASSTMVDDPGDINSFRPTQNTTRKLPPLSRVIQKQTPAQEPAPHSVPSGSPPPGPCNAGIGAPPEPETGKDHQKGLKLSKGVMEEIEKDMRIILGEDNTDEHDSLQDKDHTEVNHDDETEMEVLEGTPQLNISAPAPHVAETTKFKAKESTTAHQTTKKCSEPNNEETKLSTGIKNLMVLVNKKKKCDEKIEHLKSIMEKKISILEAKKKKLEKKINLELTQMNEGVVSLTSEDEDNSEKSDAEDMVSDIGSPLSDRSKSPEVPKAASPTLETTKDLPRACVSTVVNTAIANADFTHASDAPVTDQASLYSNANTKEDDTVANDTTTTSASQSTGAMGCPPVNQEHPKISDKPQVIKVIKDASAASFGKNTELEAIVQQVHESANNQVVPSSGTSEKDMCVPTFRLVIDNRASKSQSSKTTNKKNSKGPNHPRRPSVQNIGKANETAVSAAVASTTASAPTVPANVPKRLQKAPDSSSLRSVRKNQPIAPDNTQPKRDVITPSATLAHAPVDWNKKMSHTQQQFQQKQAQPYLKQMQPPPYQSHLGLQHTQIVQQLSQCPQQVQQPSQHPLQAQQPSQCPQPPSQRPQQPQQPSQHPLQAQQPSQCPQPPLQRPQLPQQPSQRPQQPQQPSQHPLQAQQPSQRSQLPQQQPSQRPQLPQQQPSQRPQLPQQPSRHLLLPQQPSQRSHLLQQLSQRSQLPQQPSQHLLQPQQPSQHSQLPQQPLQNPQQPSQHSQLPQQPLQHPQQPQQPQQHSQLPQQPQQHSQLPQQPLQNPQQAQQLSQLPQQAQQPPQQPQQMMQPQQQLQLQQILPGLRRLFNIMKQSTQPQRGHPHPPVIPQQKQVPIHSAQPPAPQQSHIQQHQCHMQQVPMQMQMQIQCANKMQVRAQLYQNPQSQPMQIQPNSQNSQIKMMLREPAQAPMVNQGMAGGSHVHQGPSGGGSMNTGIRAHPSQEPSTLPVSTVSGNMSLPLPQVTPLPANQCNMPWQVSSATSNSTWHGPLQVSNRFPASVSVVTAPVMTPAVAHNMTTGSSNMLSVPMTTSTGNGNPISAACLSVRASNKIDSHNRQAIQNQQQVTLPLPHQNAHVAHPAEHAAQQFLPDNAGEGIDTPHEENWCFICGKVGEFTCCNGIVYCSETCQSIDWERHLKDCSKVKT